MSIKITQAAIEAGAKNLLHNYGPYIKSAINMNAMAEAVLIGSVPHLAPPIQTTPAPSSLANDAGEGGLNSRDMRKHTGGFVPLVPDKDCKSQPQNVQSHAATATDVAGEEVEVERVAMCLAWHEAHEVTLDNYDWTSMHPEGQAKWKKTARAAIRAIREGGERWGVFQISSGSFIGNAPTSGDDFTTTDRNAAVVVCDLMDRLWSQHKYEVRPYTPARAKTPETREAIGGLEVTYTIPESMGDDDAIEYINKHLAAMSDLHRALGGSGLRVIPRAAIRDASKGGQDGK